MNRGELAKRLVWELRIGRSFGKEIAKTVSTIINSGHYYIPGQDLLDRGGNDYK